MLASRPKRKAQRERGTANELCGENKSQGMRPYTHNTERHKPKAYGMHIYTHNTHPRPMNRPGAPHLNRFRTRCPPSLPSPLCSSESARSQSRPSAPASPSPSDLLFSTAGRTPHHSGNGRLSLPEPSGRLRGEGAYRARQGQYRACANLH